MISHVISHAMEAKITCYIANQSLVPRPPLAFFNRMKKSGELQAIKAGDEAKLVSCRVGIYH